MGNVLELESKINLNRLEIFNSVVIAGSFSKAATQLHQPKSRISRNISALEEEMGVQLIYRTTRQFKLTEAGHSLFKRSGPLISELKNTLESVSLGADEIAGTIRVTVPDDIGTELMGRICREFSLMYPHVRLNVHASNEVVDLVKESIDVAVRIGKVRDSTMIQRKIGSVQMRLCVSSDFFKNKSIPGQFQALEKLPFLAFTPRDSKLHTLRLTNGKETRALKLTPVFSANNFFILREMILEGMGMGYLPPFLAQKDLHSGRLVTIFKDWATEPTPSHILIPQQKEVPLRIRKFVDFLSQKLAIYLQ